MTSLDLHVSPLGRVEGDLDVRVTIEDGVVTSAWTEAAMFRGFEIILRGKDPQAGLIVCPRICGICGGSHLYKSAYALDTAWRTHMPANATLVRNIAQACETLQSIPRYFYALFAIDLCNKNYAKSSMYDEAVRRFAPYVGTAYQKGVVLSQKPVEVYAIFGGQWPHSSFMVPGGVMGAATLSDVTRSIAILENWKDNWLESDLLGCSIDRWLENKTWEDVLAWVDENESQRNSDLGFFIRYSLDIGLDKFGQGVGNYISHRHLLRPEAVFQPDHRGPQQGAHRPRRHLRRRPVARVRPVPGPRGCHPLVLRGHPGAAPVRGGDHPGGSGGGQEAGQVQLGQIAPLRVGGPGQPAAGDRSAGPPDGRGRTRTPLSTRTTIRCSSTSTTRSGPAC